ncbi:MAG: S26 family signal peptidase, partial [Nitrospirota bacterium]|nr:S26 family signal peptidase [Nitrospirota bacterium]
DPMARHGDTDNSLRCRSPPDLCVTVSAPDRRWIVATAIVAFALLLMCVRVLDAPLVLYPASASIPKGLYLRTFERPAPGKIIAFAMPDAARRYRAGSGAEVTSDFLFMKPIIAGPGDRVCNSVAGGLAVNGTWLAPTTTHDREAHPLPLWVGCRVLGQDRFFTFSNWVPNSLDSRYFGPIDGADIAGVYRPLGLSFLLSQEGGS